MPILSLHSQTFQAAIFDMDGTLVDSMPHHHKAWMAFLERNNIDLTAETFERDYHKGTLIEVMARLFPEIQEEDALRAIGNQKEALFREMYASDLKPIKGVIPFFDRLKQEQIPIGLSTMGDQNNIDFTLKGIDLETYFKATTGGHQVVQGKPDPEIFLATAQKLGIPPEKCLAFEDTRSGIAAAQAAGMQVIGVATQFSNATLIQELRCLDAIEDYHQLLSKILFPESGQLSI